MSAGKPCTDDTDGDAALNMRYNQQPSLPRVAYCDKPILTNRVTRVEERGHSEFFLSPAYRLTEEDQNIPIINSSGPRLPQKRS